MSTSFSNAVLCVGLKNNCLGSTVQDLEATADVTARCSAKKGKMKVTKKILEAALKPAKQRRAAARKWFNSVTLPGISEDLRIIPPSQLKRIQEEIQKVRDEDWEWLQEKFIPNYESAKAQDRIDLGTAYDENLYPPVENLPAHFNILLTVTDMPAGDYARVQGLDASAKAQMEEQHQKMLVQIGNSARNEVMRKMAELIGKIAEKMSDPDAKKFHETTFSNLTEYLALVPDLNITGDPLLASICAEAKEKLSYSMKVVKDSDFLKEQAATAAKDILKRFGAQGTGRKLVA